MIISDVTVFFSEKTITSKYCASLHTCSFPKMISAKVYFSEDCTAAKKKKHTHTGKQTNHVTAIRYKMDI